MRFVAIEFKDDQGAHVKGYLRIPMNFTSGWHIGFMRYLQSKYNTKSPIQIYPLHVHLTPSTMGKRLAGYVNMEDDFNMALRSNCYYPLGEETDYVRRSWTQLDPMSHDYKRKHR